MKWLVAVGCFAVAAAFGYVHFFLSRPIGSGAAGPPVPAKAFEHVWTQRSVLLLGIGDSITAGLGAASIEHSYFRRLIENPEDEYPDMRGSSLGTVLPSLTHENIAVSGSTSLQHADFIRERLQPQAAEVFGIVVMTTGGNDLIHNYGRSPPREGAMYGATLEQAKPWIRSFESRLETMLDDLANLFSGGHEVYLADIYDPTDGVGDAPSIFLPRWDDGLKIHAEYNQAIHRVVHRRENVFLVPLRQTFMGHGSHCKQFWRKNYDAADPYYWFYSNVEDPNDRGYDAIRRAFLNAIILNSQLRSP